MSHHIQGNVHTIASSAACIPSSSAAGSVVNRRTESECNERQPNENAEYVHYGMGGRSDGTYTEVSCEAFWAALYERWKISRMGEDF